MDKYVVFISIFFLLSVSTRGGFACFSSDHWEQINIRTGSPLYYECHCKEPGNSVKNLKWIDIHGNEISSLGPGTESEVYTEWTSRGLSLQIQHFSKTMSGVYKCVAEHNGRNYTIFHAINAYEPPHFIHEEDNQYIINGKDSLVSCETKNESNFMITWHKLEDDLTQIMNDDKYEISPKGLLIKNVTDEDAGLYICSALVLEAADSEDLKINVHVVTLPTISDLKVIPDTDVVVGEPLSIECVADGTPQPEYKWVKLNSKNSENTTWRQDFNTIVFNAASEDDEGTYACIAGNVGGDVKKDIYIQVLMPPKIISLNNVTAREGSIAQIICKSTGNPRPRINITFLMEDVEDDPSIIWNEKNDSRETTFILTFQNVNRQHTGAYTCNASNEVDYVAEQSYLEVLYKPHFEEPNEVIWGWHGLTVNLSCEHDSNPESTVVWRHTQNEINTHEQTEINKLLLAKLNNMTERSMALSINKDTLYGIYECTAKNDMGESTKTIILKRGFAPPPIKNISITDLTARSVVFDIEGPDKIYGPPVTGFICEYDPAESYDVTNIHRNRTWAINVPYKLDELKPNTLYFIKCAAKNDVGDGLYSDTVEFKTPEKSVPDAPTWEDLENSENNRIVKWKTPENNGDPIDYYILKHCPKHEENIKQKECKEHRVVASEVNLVDLNHNTTYYLQLTAHNSYGNSTPVEKYIQIPEEQNPVLLSASAIIGISIAVVILCLVVIDLILLFWRKQGITATCCYKKNKNRKEEPLQSRDTKGLLKDSREAADDTLKRVDNGHKEFQYNKNTGVITGKHSAV